MRAVVVVSSMALLVACGKPAETPAAEAGKTDPAAAKAPAAEAKQAADPAKPAAQKPAAEADSAKPKPKPAAVSSTPAPVAANADPAKARATAAEMKALEKTPGATKALKTTTASATKKHPDIVGKPGPSPAAGPDDAPVKVYIFSDFQCPVCKRVVEPAKFLARELGDKVQIIFKQNALEMHPNAFIAAAASMAAYKQGKFWEYHDKLFQNQRNLAEPDLLVYAEEIGLDMTRFKKDMNSSAIKDQIEYESNQAIAMGMRGTPGFFVNGQKMVGWGSYGGFRSVVNRALKNAEGVNLTTRTAKKDVARVATEKFGGEGAAGMAEFMWGKK